jgi:GT2 family glycosyltransferase
MKVTIILVNWKGWRDTIECLESVFRLDYPDFRVIVVDNASGDGSVERIKEWAAGQRGTEVSDTNLLSGLTMPGIPKPVRWIEYQRDEAEAGGYTDEDAPLVLIHSEENLGYAGGNNIGLRYALNRPGFGYAWLLNNDTVVEISALSALVQRSQAVPLAGIVGSTLLFYNNPDIVQAYGGARFNRWLGTAKMIGGNSRRRSLDAQSVAEIERETTYVIGASMLVTSSFLREVGLMEESYFLYCEEIDWARRGYPRYQLAYAPESIVYHKMEQSTGRESLLSLHFLFRSGVHFMRRHYPVQLPIVYLRMIWQGVKALLRGRRTEFTAICMVIRDPESWPAGVCKPKFF